MSRSTRTTRGRCPTSAARPSRSALGLGLDWPLGTAESVWTGERPWRGRLGEAGDRAVPGNRAVPGRWEGDLLIGNGPQVSSGHLGRADHPLHPAAAPARATPTWPGTRCGRRSPPGPPTWPAPSPGTGANEMGLPRGLHHRHRHPGLLLPAHKPWQRGSNENTNGLLHKKVLVAAHPAPARNQSTVADPGGGVARPIGPTSGRAAGRRNTGTPGSCGPGRRRTKSMTC